jgi:hypothetical protein
MEDKPIGAALTTEISMTREWGAGLGADHIAYIGQVNSDLEDYDGMKK